VTSRASRPPGFEMSYRPTQAVFAAPLLARIPSLVYLACAVLAAILVVVGEQSAPGSWLHNYVVVQDRSRLLSARAFALVLCIGAVSSVLRSNMRGVRLHQHGLEARDVSYLLLPVIRRYRWPQIERIQIVGRRVSVLLWDGRATTLPVVGDVAALAAALERVAAVREIAISGGRGLDEVPEKGEPVAEKQQTKGEVEDNGSD